MAVQLACDAPDCGKTTEAIARLGAIAAPRPWWINITAGVIRIACCDDHVVAAVKGREGA